MWQNNRAERDKSHFETRMCTSAWQKRLLWSSTSLDFSLSICLSSLWITAALCILVCIATVLLGLCVFFFFNLKKKRLFSLQRVHESIPPPQKKKDYLKQCSLRKEQKYIQWFCARTATFLIFFFISLLYSQRPGSFHLKHASLVRKWHSAHSEAPMQFRYVMWKCWVGLGHIMMSNSEAHMSYGLYLLEQWFPTCGSQDELEGSKWREEWKEIR